MRKLIAMLMACTIAVTLAGCSGKKEAGKQFSPEQVKDKSQQGMELVHSGKFEEANKVLEEVATAKDLDAKTYIMLGISRFQKNDYKGAIEAYDKAIALDPKLAEPYQGKANIYRNQKSLKEAEVWYRKAWQANPQYIDAYTELALQLRLANRLPDAIAVIQEGLKNNPGVIDLQVVVGQYHAENNQKDLARQAFEAVLKVDPQNKQAKDALAALTQK